MPPQLVSSPVHANYPSDKLTIGAGVAIFHLATGRVVVCYHSRDKYWFLPKGRKNANETVTTAAEREGFEESGYRNRVLPLPFKHRQTAPASGREDFATEALWVQLLPLTSINQYLLFWYAAETLPEADELAANEKVNAKHGSAAVRAYEAPPPLPKTMTLRQRIQQDKSVNTSRETAGATDTVYEPIWHEGTGVDEEERLYESYLLPVAEAKRKLKGTVMEDVVTRAWEAIELRLDVESQNEGLPGR